MDLQGVMFIVKVVPCSTIYTTVHKKNTIGHFSCKAHFMSHNYHGHAFLSQLFNVSASTSPTISGSRALVGSSNNIISGFMARARAIATLSAFDHQIIVLALLGALSCKPTRFKSSNAFSFACSFVAFFNSTGGICVILS